MNIVFSVFAHWIPQHLAERLLTDHTLVCWFIMAPRMALLAFLGTAGAMKCPGSSSWVHASAKVEVLASATCQDVMEEIKARVAGNEAGTWHDPHNGGTYSLLKARTPKKTWCWEVLRRIRNCWEWVGIICQFQG